MGVYGELVPWACFTTTRNLHPVHHLLQVLRACSQLLTSRRSVQIRRTCRQHGGLEGSPTLDRRRCVMRIGAMSQEQRGTRTYCSQRRHLCCKTSLIQTKHAPKMAPRSQNASRPSYRSLSHRSPRSYSYCFLSCCSSALSSSDCLLVLNTNSITGKEVSSQAAPLHSPQL